MENLDIYTNLMKIDLGAISHNYVELKKYIQAKNSTSEVGLVLKSNAYAIGIKEVAPIVYAAGARKFFVMWIGEAITLRKMLPDAVIITHQSSRSLVVRSSCYISRIECRGIMCIGYVI